MENKKNGISDWSIDPCRAFALINNPCASDNDPALVVVFDEKGTPVGYTAAFAEDYVEGGVQGRYYWGSTEWINPECRGKGIAAIMMHTIKEAVGYQNYLALDSSEASVRLDVKQGSEIQYFKRYKYKLFSDSSVKSRWLSHYVSMCNKKSLQKMSEISYKNRYVTFIDKKTYDFIRSNASNDLFLRQRSMFNWILHYPFLVPVGMDRHASKNVCNFGSVVKHYLCQAICVMVGNDLAGVYIVSQTDKVRSLRYLYYEPKYQDRVLASVATNLLSNGAHEIRFFSESLHQFMLRCSVKRLNSKTISDEIAFTHPGGMKYDESLLVHGGDGDMFV